MLVTYIQWSKRARNHPLVLTPDNLAVSILRNTQSRVPKYVQDTRVPNGKSFICDMLKLLHWVPLWCTEFTTLSNLPVHCSHSFDASQHSVAPLATSRTRKADRWGMQILPGQRFFVQKKDKGIYSKTPTLSNHVFRLIGEEAKIKAAQKDQKRYITSQQAVLTYQRQLLSLQSPTLVPAIMLLSANANRVTYPFQW